MKRRSQCSVDSYALETLEPRSMMAADLAPGGITVASPNYPLSAATRSFMFSIANVGTTGVPAGTVVNFYLSRDGLLDSSDRFVRRSVLPDAIRPGTSAMYSKVMRVPSDMDGDYRLIAKVDPTNTISESNETNNSLPSASINIFNPPKAESVTINKRFIRPGSQATVTAHNVTNVDPTIAQVRFYRRPGHVRDISPGNDPSQVLLGTGTRVGSDYVFTFVADNQWLEASNVFYVRIDSPGRVWFGGVEVEARRIEPPSIDSFTFSPLIRGQYATFTATGVSSEAAFMTIAYDSNFNSRYDQNPSTRLANDQDRFITGLGGGTWSRQFQVPDWFPSAPTLVFVVVSRYTGGIQQVYPVYLIAS